MQKDHHIETESEKEMRWQRVLAMTDEENEANIASDTDSQTPIDMKFLKRGIFVHGEQQVLVPIILDTKSVQWLHDHNIDLQSIVSGMVSDLTMK